MTIPRRMAPLALALPLLLPGAAIAAPAWTTPEFVSAAGQDALAPSLAVRDGGGAMLVWQRSNGTHHIVQSTERTRAAAAWSTPADRSPAGSSATVPDVAITADGDAIVAWVTGSAMKTTVRQDGAWGAVETRAGGASPGAPAVAMNADGYGRLAWRSTVTGFAHLVLAGHAPGAGWGATDLLFGSARPDTPRPDLAVSDGGSAVAYGSDGDVLARIDTGGGWIEEAVVGSAATSAPRVAIAPSGVVVVVWRGTHVGRSAIWAARHTGAGWETPTPVASSVATLSAPDVAVGGTGEAVVAWSEPTGTDAVVWTASATGGTWSDPVPVVLSLDTTAGAPGVAMGQDGAALVAWDQDSPDGTTVRAAVRPPGGAWGAPTALGSNRPTEYDGSAQPITQDVAVEVDDGSPVVAWRDTDGANSRVMTATYDRTGPPHTAVTVPTSAQTGTPVDVSVTVGADISSVPGNPVWSWGDGTATASGASAQHTYATAGTYTVTVSSADGLGNTRSTTRTITVTAPAPTPPPPPPADPPTSPADPAPPTPPADPDPGQEPVPAEPDPGVPALTLPARITLRQPVLPLTVRCTGGDCEIRIQVRFDAGPVVTRTAEIAEGRRFTTSAPLPGPAAARLRRSSRLGVTVTLSRRVDGAWKPVSTARTTLTRMR